ncbi:MAG TPA: cyclic nucleotide-binding domain-containing protein [Roseiflexaceae bacterium]|nr:cyclic nucleotide-binding domain-containing protein [Roseiflexaceae bacterium]
MGATIQRATTEAELGAIGLLRYDMYVEELRIFADAADHEQRTLIEPIDATAAQFYAALHGQVVGALRVEFGADTPFAPATETAYDLARFRATIADPQVAICTRLVVRAEYSTTPVLLQLLVAMARFAAARGVELILYGCQPHQISFFTSIGFRGYRQVFNDPEFGILMPLALLTGDLEYLEAIGSPLSAFLTPQTASIDTARALADQLDETTTHPDSEDGIPAPWREIYRSVTSTTSEAPHLFDDLTESEVRRLLTRSQLIECAPGDRVIRRGLMARTIFVVLAGALEIRESGRLVRVARRGDLVGELAFLLDGRRTADVYAAASGTRVLALHEKNLRQLIDERSRLAATVLHNLSKILAYKLSDYSHVKDGQ